MTSAEGDGREEEERGVAERDQLDDILRELARTSDLPDDDAALIGRTLGRFTITARLGAGGMGVVYRARDAKLGRDVALKVLAPALAHDATARARLLREARAAAVIQHPNIATVYDVDEHEGVPFIALEIVEGLNLRDRLRRAAGLPLREVRTIARGVAAALAAAHAAGVIHRDLKPDNIVLTHTAGVKVLDFGLARRVDDESAPTARRLTRRGDVLGTIGYLSPEQALGKPLDARSDVFSFGVLVYEMLSGRLPFRGTTWGEAAVALANDRPPPLLDLRSDVPEPLLELVERCLSRAPRDRFADGAALLEPLSRLSSTFTSATSSSARAPLASATGSGAMGAHADARPSLARRAVVAAAVLTLVVGSVVVGSRWSWWSAPEPPSLTSIPVVSDDAAVQRGFRMAVQLFYAGDTAAAARALDDVLRAEPGSVPAIALRVLAGHPESGDRTRADRLQQLEAAALATKGNEAEIGAYLAKLWRRMNVDAEGHSISSDVSSLRQQGDALRARAPDDYFAAMLVTASLPTGTLQERVAGLDALLSVDDGPVVAWLWKVWTLQRGDRADEAGRVLEEALERHPGNRVLQRERGIVASLQRDFQVAERELRRVLDEDPTDTYARIELAGVLFELGKEDEWRRELSVVLDGPSRAGPAGRAVLAAVTALPAQGRFQESKALVDRAFVLLHDAGRFDIAATFLSQRAREELLVGRAAGVQGWLEAMEDLIAKPELDDHARRRLQGDRLRLGAELHLLAGDVNAAHDDLTRLAALSDEHFPPEVSRERTSARLAARITARRGSLEPALLAFERAFDGSARQPRDDEEALSFLAVLHRDAGDVEAADGLYARVLALRSRCDARALWWESICRMYLAEAAVSRAEIARERGDAVAVRARLDELDRIWPRPDGDLPLVERASAVRAAIRTLARDQRAPPPSPRR